MLSFTRYVFSCLFTIAFFLPTVVYAAQDAQSILIICSYNPAAHKLPSPFPISWMNIPNVAGNTI